MLLTAVAGICMFAAQEMAPPGQLSSVTKDGKTGILCPLKQTNVNAEISGFGARVTLVQTFTNPTAETIEAIYTFPLPSDAAVDRMRIRVGGRVVAGVIKRREEAQAIYEAAKAQGKVAALLDQERPNIFTQSVANITPKASIEVEVSYVQLLKFEDGRFEFMYPMVVGPRFIPLGVSDAQKVTPPTLTPNMRSGANIRMTVSLDAGAPITSMESVLHKVNISKKGAAQAVVTLAKQDEIPNRDFILRYSCATDTVKSALLTHADDNGGTFALILMPPKAVKQEMVQPREMIFVMDQSGSQNGFPIEKSKELTNKLIETLGANDSFNVISFSDGARTLWDIPRKNSAANRTEAQIFVSGLRANGGTQLLPAVEAAFNRTADPNRVRIVLFNTDGFVGNDFEVLKAVQEHRGSARMFTFSIGNGVNRFLIDSMSAEGRGDSEIVTLAEKADAAVERFTRRLRYPVLTDVQLTATGGGISDVLPVALPDVFSEKPVIVMGHYNAGGPATFTLTGNQAGKPWSFTYKVDLPKEDKDGSAISTLWARAKVDDLMRQDWLAHRGGNSDAEKLQDQIAQIGLQYGIVTQYTSFVAVEERVVNVGGKQRRVQVPVEMTEGVTMGMDSDGGRLALRGQTAGLARGGGGGGFGGASSPGAPPASASKVAEKEDKASNEAVMTPEQKKQARYERIVAKDLRVSKSGTFEVQILLSKLDAADGEKLTKLGFKIEARDDKAKVLYGTVDVKKLFEMAQIDSVVRISKL